MRYSRALVFGLGLACLCGADSVTVRIDGGTAGRVFDGLGAISGGGGNSRLLIDYPEPYRGQILDYLFKPGVGASLQILKVEIGGDGNSTSGSEPSHMHSADDENYDRGYEWWLMEEAKARNPAIKLMALEWTAPGWIGNGTNFWSQDNVDYIVKWIQGAKRYHGLTIDYVGGWNECYRGWDPAWFRKLKSALAASGLATKIIGADEYYPHLTALGQALISDPSFYADMDVAGVHYPCNFSPITGCSSIPKILGLTKPMWASESNSDAAGIARVTNLMYIDAKITASVVWPLVGAVFPNVALADAGLIIANEPGTGRYSVDRAVWAAAHTTQFAQPGWRYLDSAAGRLLGSGGSYVGYAAPNGSDYSVVVETLYASSSYAVTFSVSGGLSTGTVEVWSTNLTSDSPDDWFVHEGSAVPENGSYAMTLRPGFIYSITTTGGQGKGSFARASGPATYRPVRLPYTDDFEPYAFGHEARLFSDMNGAFEVAPCSGGRIGRCLRQMSAVHPYFWWVTPDWQKSSDPYALLGDVGWTDYRLSVDFLLEQGGGVMLFGRTGAQSPWWPEAIPAYVLRVGAGGNWSIQRRDDQGITTGLSFGQVPPIGTGTWHRAALILNGSAISAELDGQVVGTVSDEVLTQGNAGLGTVGWINAQFDNFSIAPNRGRAGWMPRQ